MTDQIAPSLATELEQAAKALEGCVWVSAPESELAYCVECLTAMGQPHKADCESSQHVALLTRAAALARAAEKWRDAYEIVNADYSNRDGIPPRTVLDDLEAASESLRALVSSEGPQERKQADEIPVGSRWRDNDSRMNDRVVTVERVDAEFVWYRSGGVYRSRRARFLKAFTREGKGE